MNVRIHFFGMIAEAVNRNTLIIEDYKGETIVDLKRDLLDQYPELGNFTFQIALNQSIASDSEKLSADNEVAILPPFAGG